MFREDQVEELIKKAVGYSEERGDEIAVQQSTLPGADTQAADRQRQHSREARRAAQQEPKPWYSG